MENLSQAWSKRIIYFDVYIIKFKYFSTFISCIEINFLKVLKFIYLSFTGDDDDGGVESGTLANLAPPDTAAAATPTDSDPHPAAAVTEG